MEVAVTLERVVVDFQALEKDLQSLSQGCPDLVASPPLKICLLGIKCILPVVKILLV